MNSTEIVFREYIHGAPGWAAFVIVFVMAVPPLVTALTPVILEIIRRPNRPKPKKKSGAIAPKQVKNCTGQTLDQADDKGTPMNTDCDGSKPEKPPTRPRVKPRPLITGLVLLIISAVMFDFVIKPPLISASSEETNAAWDYFNKGQPDPIRELPANREKLNQAIRIADSVIEKLRGSANEKEKSLPTDPIPPIGKVSDAEREAIFAYGPINDVATCLWIKGRAYAYLNRPDDAISAYKQLADYPHARIWDGKGSFWSPSEDARGRLDILQNPAPK